MTGDIEKLSVRSIHDQFSGRSESLEISAGLTIAEIVSLALPRLPLTERQFVRVALVNERGSIIVEHDYWEKVRPKIGAHVVIRLIPGKSALRAILQIVVSIGAIALGQFWAAPLAGGIGTFGGQIAAAVVSLGAPIFGNLQINSINLVGGGSNAT